GAAAWNVPFARLSVAGAIDGSCGCTMFESRYVPGALVLIGSPCAEVEKMTYCALLASPQVSPGTSASALRGLAMMAAGRPDAIERRPSIPPPKRVPRSTSLRASFMIVSSHSDAAERRRETRDDERGPERVGRLHARGRRGALVMLEELRL